MHIFVHSLILASGLLVWPPAASSHNSVAPESRPAPSVETIVARIDSVLAAGAEQGMNGVVRVEVDDEVLLHRAYGYRDREADDPMTTSVGFDIGSLVKPITAVAVLTAEEEGHLDTDDTLAEHFPDVPSEKRGITIDQLLRHRAGFQDYIGRDYELVNRAEALERILKAPLKHPPGSKRAYSNSGYTLLAIILERTTGRSYEAYVRDAVLDPVGVSGIGYVLPPWPADDLAVGYEEEGKRWGTPVEQPWLDDGVSWTFRGAGGMLGTAEQMARWYEGLVEGEILGPRALENYLDFGAEPAPSGEGRWMAHAGGNGVFNTVHAAWIKSDVHFTIFTSTASPLNAETVIGPIMDDILALATAARARESR